MIVIMKCLWHRIIDHRITRLTIGWSLWPAYFLQAMIIGTKRTRQRLDIMDIRDEVIKTMER